MIEGCHVALEETQPQGESQQQTQPPVQLEGAEQTQEGEQT